MGRIVRCLIEPFYKEVIIIKDINLKDFTVNFAFISSFISVYILDNNHNSPLYSITRILNLGLTLILLCLLFLIVISIIKWPLSRYLTIFVLINIIVMTFFIRNYINFHWIYLLFIVFYVYSDTHLNERVIKYTIFLCILSVLYQMFSNRFLGNPVLSWQDPNYSAYYLFVLFAFLRKSKFKLYSWLILVLGFLTISRAYILAVLVYFLFEKIAFLRKIVFKFKLNSFFKLAVLSIMAVLLIGSFFLTIEVNSNNHQTRSIDRVTDINDMSNKDRFLANKKFINELIKHPNDFLFGMDMEKYTDKIFHNTPHNSFMALIVNYGILFSVIFLFIFGKCINKLFYYSNVSIIMAQFIYFSFLGSGFQGYPGILVIFALKYCTDDNQMKMSKMVEK